MSVDDTKLHFVTKHMVCIYCEPAKIECVHSTKRFMQNFLLEGGGGDMSVLQ